MFLIAFWYHFIIKFILVETIWESSRELCEISIEKTFRTHENKNRQDSQIFDEKRLSCRIIKFSHFFLSRTNLAIFYSFLYFLNIILIRDTWNHMTQFGTGFKSFLFSIKLISENDQHEILCNNNLIRSTENLEIYRSTRYFLMKSD